MGAPVEFMRLVHTVTAAEGAAGNAVTIPIRNIPEQINGWPVHVLGFVFDLTIQVDTNVAMPNAFDGHHQFSLIQNMVIRAGNHHFVQGLDALDLHKENRIRQSVQEADPADIADATASDVTRNTRFRYMFVHPDAPSGHRYDGAVPSALLSTNRRPDTSLTFNVGTAAIPAIASVTVDQVTGPVYALCVALPKLRIPPPMRTRVLDDTNLELLAQPHGPIEYLALVDREDNNDQFTQNQSQYDNFNFWRDDFLMIDGRAESFASIFHNELRNYRSAAAIGTENSPEYIPLIVRPDTFTRTKYARARAGCRFEVNDTRGGRNNTRLMWREWGIHNRETLSDWLNILGVRDADAARLEPIVSGKGRPSPEAAGVLDANVWFDGDTMEALGYNEPGRKSDRKIAEAA